ncbi:MAG TPA: NAD(P)/FAD-dependent oxidoreductase, partial [Lentzea sp.]
GELTGRGVYYGASTTEGPNCAGQDVYLVGGANSAGQAAVYFSGHARKVVILVRGDSLEQSMSRYLIDQLEAIPNVEVRTHTEVCGGTGEDHLETLTLLHNKTGETTTVQASWLFAFIGAAPRTDWLDGTLERDEHGFLLAGPDLGGSPPGWDLERAPYHLETNLPGVFVAGDVRADSVKRVASAVGEGAMAVTLVHRYLERS